MDCVPDRSVAVVIPVRDESADGVAEILRYYREGHWMDPERIGWQLIIVDDGSTTPFPEATYRHEAPRGYGAALKTGIANTHAHWIVTMDGDGQHRVRDMVRLVEFTRDFPGVDLVIGDRRVKEAGVRLWGRRALNWLASLFACRWIADLNSGLRIFRREIAMGYFPILSDGFSFTTSLTLSMLADRYQVDWLPILVSPRSNGTTNVKLWQDGWRTVKLILWIGGALRTRTLRRWVRPLTTWLLRRP